MMTIMMITGPQDAAVARNSICFTGVETPGQGSCQVGDGVVATLEYTFGIYFRNCEGGEYSV